MMKKLLHGFKPDAYFVTLVLLAISLPFSKFTLSLFQLVLVLLWLGSGFSQKVVHRFFRKASWVKAIWLTITYFLSYLSSNFVLKLKLFINNKVAVLLASIYFLHVLGLLNTTDFDYAFKDLRVKLPLLIFPLVLATMPAFDKRKTHILLAFFSLAVFTGTLISLYAYLRKDFDDIRDISLYISAVRFSLMVVFAIFILLFGIIKLPSLPWMLRGLMLLVSLWMVVFLIILESVIGVVSLIIILDILLLREAIKIKNVYLKTAILATFILIPISIGWYMAAIVNEVSHKPALDIAAMEQYSKLGNAYRHDTINFGVEDGKYVGIYFAETELAEAWNKRSTFDFYGKDEAGQLIMYTIIRYLTSVDLRKDASGVAALTAEDIRFIEKGIANKSYVKRPSLKNRISKIIVGYEQFALLQNPNGSSVMQRVEHLKASMILAKSHFWRGVGTGDMPAAFSQTYEEMNSPLKPELRWRSHNQYFSFLIAFGIFGLLWFLFVLLYPAFVHGKIKSGIYLAFLLLMLLSMLSEDTLETQIGVSLFAFFTSFFLLTSAPETTKEKENLTSDK